MRHRKMRLKLNILSEEEKLRIHAASIKILAEVGGWVIERQCAQGAGH